MSKYLTVIILFLYPFYALAGGGDYEIAFSPRGGGTELIVKAITEAQQSIQLAAYSFTSQPIARALKDAHKRGVKVQVVLDKSQKYGRYTSATYLANTGIPVRINSRYAIMHNKFMIIDNKNVQLGSFNYTKAAEEKNAENVLLIRNDPKVAHIYYQNWKKLWDEAENYPAKY